MKRRTRIYVAGPLNALACDYLKNVHQMMQCAEALRKKGYSVYVPALDLLMGLTFGNYEYGDYFENSQPWLDASDAMGPRRNIEWVSFTDQAGGEWLVEGYRYRTEPQARPCGL